MSFVLTFVAALGSWVVLNYGYRRLLATVFSDAVLTDDGNDQSTRHSQRIRAS